MPADIHGLIQLIIYILLAGLVIYAISFVISLLALPETVRKIVLIILALIVLLWLLIKFGIA